MKHHLSRITIVRLAVAFVTIFAVMLSCFLFFELRMYYQRRENNLYLAANQARLISGSLNEVMERAYTLRALVKTNDGSTDFFEESVRDMYAETEEDTGLLVKNFIVAPDGVVEQIYPLEGNEGMIGFDYMDESLPGNEAAIEAYRQNKFVITKPFSLKQGGTGIAGRLPVTIADENGNETYWGMVSVTLDFTYLMEKFNLSYLEQSGTNYCLWYAEDNGEKAVLASSAKMPSHPITYEVSIDNLDWNLDVEPSGGWIPLFEIFFGIFVILLISVMALRVLHSRAKIRELNVVLQALAIKDNLTGCYSRHYVNTAILDAETKEWRDKSANYSLALLDVDNFKEINDTYGHEYGDQALRTVARLLQDSCDDLRGDCVIRYGGDEFIILMNDIPREVFEKRLDKIVKNVRELRIPGEPDMRLTVSVGAVVGSRSETYYDLFERADKQVYLAKNNGKDRYCIEGNTD